MCDFQATTSRSTQSDARPTFTGNGNGFFSDFIMARRHLFRGYHPGSEMNRGRIAHVSLVAACRNRPELPGFRQEILNLMTPFAHLPVVIPRHLAVPLRWYHRHGTSRRPASPPPRQASPRQTPCPQSEPRTRDPQAGPACRRGRGPAPEEEQSAQDSQARP